MSNIVAGIDIGGSHITTALVDLQHARILEHTRVRNAIDPSQHSTAIIHAWAEAIKICYGKYDMPVDRIGIAMPGPFDYEEGISFIKGLHKYETLYGLNVKALLSAELNIQSAHIRMINDATAFLCGEAKAGAGKGCKHVSGITLGTGLGSALYLNDQFEEMELWSFPFRNDRAEEFLSTRWFISAYEERSSQKVAGVKDLATIANTDPIAMQLFKDFGCTLAEVLVQKFSNHFPQRIVVGGNIAKAWHLFQHHCKDVLNEQGFVCELVPAQLGEDAALIGAAYLWD
ncbi:MAG: ROK family protein [Agriterribacter sp.]